jgi:hypothetical protein
MEQSNTIFGEFVIPQQCVICNKDDNLIDYKLQKTKIKSETEYTAIKTSTTKYDFILKICSECNIKLIKRIKRNNFLRIVLGLICASFFGLIIYTNRITDIEPNEVLISVLLASTIGGYILFKILFSRKIPRTKKLIKKTIGGIEKAQFIFKAKGKKSVEKIIPVFTNEIYRNCFFRLNPYIENLYKNAKVKYKKL